jgi:hypothetical protein
MPRKIGYGRGRPVLALQDDFATICFEAARIDALDHGPEASGYLVD